MDKTNCEMADIGASQHKLVEPQPDTARKLPQYIAALSATLGAIAAGTLVGWSSPVVFQITQPNSTEYDFDITTGQGTWISSVFNLGAAAACFPVGLTMDILGRKKTMLLLVLPFTLAWVLIIWAVNVPMLIIGRFIAGLSGGAFCVTVPAYTSEIAQDSIRGALGTYFQLMFVVGILFSYTVGSYTSVFLFNILCALLPLIFGVIFFFMPESPHFLVTKGRNEEARQALIKLRGRNYDVDCELNKMMDKKEERRHRNVSFYTAIRRKTAVKALIICYALMVFQQLSGITAVIFNTAAIFSSAGAAMDPNISSIIIGGIQVVATFTSSLIIDKLGRRILLLFSAFVMSLCSTALGVFFFLLDRHGESSDILAPIGWLPLVALSLFIISISLGFGPIPYMMAAELCLIDIKAFVASTAGTLNYLLAFGVTSSFSGMSAALGTGPVFWMFAGIMVLAFVFVFFVVPETKGKSVAEIQILLGEKPSQPLPTGDKKNSMG